MDISKEPPADPTSRLSSILPCPQVPLPSHLSTLPILSRSSIALRIAAGELLVIHAPLVYRIPLAWLSIHPGGDLAILHYVGRDASNEIEAYHAGRTVKERMSRWIVGRVDLGEDGWRDMVPPVQLHMWPIPVPRITVSAAESDASSSSSSDDEKKVPRYRKINKIPSDSSMNSPMNSPNAKREMLTPDLVDPEIDDMDLLPLTPAYQYHLRQSQRRLHAHIQRLGLDTPPPFLSGYGPSIVIYVALFIGWVYLYKTATGTLGYLASAIVMGAWLHQVTFVVHDAGHTELTGNWWWDRVVGILLADFLGGLSVGWWCDNHTVHHLVTNSCEHDPDIEHLPFFAISTRFFEGLRSSYYRRIMVFDKFAQFVLPYQHKLYYIIMCFARFNLFAMSYQFLLTKMPAKSSPLFKLRLLEFAGLAFYATWYSMLIRGIEGVGNRFMFVLVSFAVTSPLHVQIVLSHFSQPVSVTSDSIPHAELLESHMHRQLRTTMDISCPTYLDFLHGGLNFQTPHHLLPRIPRFRFRAVAIEVQKWVEAERELVKDGMWEGRKLKENEGLVYKKMEFVEANRSVLGVLKSVGEQVVLLAKVAEADAKGELRD